MSACLLKRVLPFTLTLVVGAALGSLTSFFGLRRQQERPAASKGYTLGSYRGGGGGCRSYKRRRFVDANRPAVILFQPLPRYTDEARRNKFTGSIRLQVRLDADGTVSDVRPLGVLPFGLTEAAEEAARNIRFTPAMRDGAPVSSWEEVRMEFVDARTVKTVTAEAPGQF